MYRSNAGANRRDRRFANSSPPVSCWSIPVTVDWVFKGATQCDHLAAQLQRLGVRITDLP